VLGKLVPVEPFSIAKIARESAERRKKEEEKRLRQHREYKKKIQESQQKAVDE